MPRQGRIHIEGGIYHVIVRGIERKKIFWDEKDRADFVYRLGEGLKPNHVKCHAWALMPNHVHLLLSPSSQPLTPLLHSLLTGYAINFNRRHKRVGHLFQNRYRSILCQKEKYYLELVRYIHLNPVRAGLVRNSKELERYPWTGHSSLVGKRTRDWQNHKEVLQYFGKTLSTSRTKYREFIAEGEGMKDRNEYEGGRLRRRQKGWEKVEGIDRTGDERILGEEAFVEESLKNAGDHEAWKEKPFKKGLDGDRITRYVCRYYGVSQEMLKNKWKSHRAGEAKAVWAYLLKTELGENGVEIGKRLGISKSGVAYLVKKGAKYFLQKSDILTF